MYSKKEILEIVDNYDLKLEMIQEVTDSVWKITTDKGTFALKKLDSNKSELIIKSLTNLSQENCGIAPILLTKDESCLVSYNDKNWYVSEWKYSDEESLDCLAIAKQLGKFHKATINRNLEFNSDAREFKYSDLINWKREEVYLSQIETEYLTNNFKSPFDKEFSASLSDLQTSINFSIKAMDKFIELENGVFPRYVLAHCKLHKSNIVGNSDGVWFIDFNNIEIDSPVRDLATFARRFSGEIDISELLTAYESENPLVSKEKKLLAIYLSYPQRLLKLAKSYYSEDTILRASINEANILEKYKKEYTNFVKSKKIVSKLWPSKSTSKSYLKK